MESITRVAEVAIRCVRAEPSSRPSASEVAGELKQASKLQEDNASISTSGDIVIESKDLQAGPIVDHTMLHYVIEILGRASWVT